MSQSAQVSVTKRSIANIVMFSLVLMNVASIRIFAQSPTSKRQNAEIVRDETGSGQSTELNAPVRKTKIAPDLEERANELSRGFYADENQKVIIELKSETPLNRMFGNNLSDADKNALFETEVKGNREKTGVLAENLLKLRGRVKKSFLNTGFVSADLPLSKIKELIENDEVAYVSPDRETGATGHIETTTGTTLVRPLLTTTVNGAGVGIAILDSGIEGTHADFKPLITSRVVLHRSFLPGNTATADKFGHGTHVAGLAAGNDIFSNGASGYYNGIAPNASLLNLRVLDDNGRGSASNAIAALDWMIANKATYNIRVANMSLGAGARDSYLNDPLCLAARRAVNAGIVVVASAGNNGKDAAGNKLYGTIGSPGIEPSVITVGAVNTFGTDSRADDTIASYSSKGPTRGYRTLANGARKYDNLIKPDLVAPGNKLIAPESLGNEFPDSATGWIYYKNNMVSAYPSLQVT
ncbi:MAG: S8 family serine peptidase, partial [Acidobacteria bacterium]|nr:S8 family serine peptidase [Acidobacteriota bacterium]